MIVGTRVRKRRMALGRSQRDVANDTGIGVSYLSRLENGRVVPSTRTLMKLAATLAVELAWFFETEGDLEPGDRCPVSLTGECILNLPRAVPGRPAAGAEAYSEDQMETLRAINYLLHKGSPEIRDALGTTVKGLLKLCEAERGEAAPGAALQPAE